MPQPGNCVVVEVDVGHLNFSRQGIRIDGEAVVVGGYFYFAGGQVLDGLVAAAVAEF